MRRIVGGAVYENVLSNCFFLYQFQYIFFAALRYDVATLAAIGEATLSLIRNLLVVRT